MTARLSTLATALLFALSTGAHSQTSATPPKRDLGAEAAGGTASSRSVVTPEQRNKMLEEQAAGKQPPAPKPPPRIYAAQPGLLAVTGGRVEDAADAGIQKITARAAKDRKSIQVYSPWGHIYSGWPQGVKPVAFTIDVAKGGGSAKISAPGFTEAHKDDYKAAIDAVVTMAIHKASAQKAAKSKM